MPIVRFRSSCPACLNPEECYYWIHSNCGGELYMNEKAILVCDSCYKQDFVFRWKFDCGKYGVHCGGFRHGCLQGFYACLSNLTKLNNPPGNFILDVINVLYEHKYEIPETY